jgi:hypothetical protein
MGHAADHKAVDIQRLGVGVAVHRHAGELAEQAGVDVERRQVGFLGVLALNKRVIVEARYVDVRRGQAVLEALEDGPPFTADGFTGSGLLGAATKIETGSTSSEYSLAQRGRAGRVLWQRNIPLTNDVAPQNYVLCESTNVQVFARICA